MPKKVSMWVYSIIQSVLLRILVWSGGKLFDYVSLYIPEGTDVVKGITFTSDENYLKKLPELIDEEDE